MRSEVTTLSVRAEEELPGIEIGNSDNIVLSGASLASVESLSMPLVQEIVLSADIRCAECQKRVADIMSRMKGRLFCCLGSRLKLFSMSHYALH
ncbi:hypothetical protein SLEP1_g51191 [Rubroshorea leprosula]|uniref:HMA domain-containing protein n=1 Tax=Rubroshorea leprosula TaxID=152421 RepID=A0AAV5M4I9_9ROSI|nr:hypothetical protein SLEP1_g51191 [Rubroshorea leprosula]